MTSHRADPSVSVIIPVRDGAATIGAQFAALAAQSAAPRFEVVVADNGSTDDLASMVASWHDRLPALRVVDASARPGASFARNVGAGAAAGSKLLFCDADDQVGEGWVAALADALDHDDLAGGPLLFDRTETGEIDLKQRNRPTDRFIVSQGFLPFTPSSNLGVRSEAFHRAGGFSSDYRRAEDTEFCWRAQVEGCTLRFVPGATVSYRQRSSYRAVFRQAFASGRDLPLLLRNYERYGLCRRSARAVLASWWWVASRTVTLVRADRRGMWLRHTGSAIGRVVGSVEHRKLNL